MLACYKQVIDTLKQLSNDKSTKGRGEIKAKICGLVTTATNVKTYYGLVLCNEIFGPCEEVAKVLQGIDMTVNDAVKSTELLRRTIRSKRTDEFAQEIHQLALDKAQELQLKLPKESRDANAPARLRQGGTGRVHKFTIAEQWRKSLFECIDLVDSEIARRFDQPGMLLTAKRERLVFDAASGRLSGKANAVDVADLELVDLVNCERLVHQLGLFADLFRVGDAAPPTNMNSLLKYFQQMDPTMQSLFSEIKRLMILTVTAPVTVASTERSFSALRRLKTWTRSTMTEQRLTQLAIMHINKDDLDNVHQEKLVDEFVARTSERISVFGARTTSNKH